MHDIIELQQPLNRWIRRLRFQNGITWSLRGLIAGLIFALAIGSLGLYQAKVVRAEFLTLVFSFALLTPILFGLIAALWQIPPLKAARHFDILFHLNERISTALELDQQPGLTSPDILNQQLADAIATAQAVDLRRQFPLHISRREGVAAILLIALISLAWLNGEARFQAAQHADNVEQAVEEQVAQIEEIIQQIEANNALTDEQKQALTEPLKEAQQNLQDNPSLESSVSVLTTTGEKLQGMSDPQTQQISEALKESGNQLSNQDGSPLQEVGNQLANGDVINAATELANIDVSELTAAEQAQLADQLQTLADSVQSTNPALADQLNQAADALNNGDSASAQQTLNEAAQSLAQTGQQIMSSQIASQTATQLQQGANQVLAAGGSTQQASGSGQGSNQSSQGSGNNGSSSGSGNEAGSNSSGTESDGDPIAQNNGPGDGGETSYEQIFAPQLLGGDGGPQIDLPPTGPNSGDVIGQGPSAPGAPGSSTVPYDEVYPQYEEINNQAIENGEVPPQFVQVIKDYFNSLRPE